MKKIVFTGGGTLGHVMPNLYLIEELKDCEISYIGSSGIEKDRVKNVVKNYYEIPAVKLIRGKIFKNLRIPFVLISAITKAKKILKKIDPDLIFSKGGYVSLPICIAGKMLGIPIITHESDYSLGLANKIILKLCDEMCVNFQNLESRSKKIVYTGPIFSRSFDDNSTNITGLNLDKEKPTILIIGGSLGSQTLNNAIYPIIKDLINYYNIIHITGKGNLNTKSYKNYNAFEMKNDMSNLYNLATIVIGRSGAGVTAEAYYKHLPMILIPLENRSTRGDQMQNANYYKEMGVAEIIVEHDLTPTLLYKKINSFMQSIDKYQMNYKKTKQINGRDIVLDKIHSYMKKRG